MAVKLMGVEESPSTTQDFIMINHPVFFVRNANDYVELTEAVAKTGAPTKFFFPGLNPFHFRLHEPHHPGNRHKADGDIAQPRVIESDTGKEDGDPDDRDTEFELGEGRHSVLT